MCRLLIATCALFWVTGCGHATSPTAASGIGGPQIGHESHSPIFAGDILCGAKLITYVRAKYPDWARRKHLQGTVELRAIIATDGSLRELKFVNGPRDLAPPAEKAVRRWRYEPCKLRGSPVEVRTTILVPFTLNQ